MFCQDVTAWRKAACSSAAFSPLFLSFFHSFFRKSSFPWLGGGGTSAFIRPARRAAAPSKLLQTHSSRQGAALSVAETRSHQPADGGFLFWDRLERLVCNPIEFWPEHGPGDSLLNRFTATAGSGLGTTGTPAELPAQRWRQAFAELASARDTCSCLPAPTRREKPPCLSRLKFSCRL